MCHSCPLGVCNRLKNLALSTAYDETPYGLFPPAGALDGEPPQAGYSGFVFLLPFLERNDVDEKFNFVSGICPANHPVQASAYELICPTIFQSNDPPGPRNMPTNYAFNIGESKIHDPNPNALPAGPFGFGKTIGIRQMQDGMSGTLSFAEVIPGQPTLSGLTPRTGSDLSSPARESSVSHFGGRFRRASGHRN